jgi:hypothetical protein
MERLIRAVKLEKAADWFPNRIGDRTAFPRLSADDDESTD